MKKVALMNQITIENKSACSNSNCTCVSCAGTLCGCNNLKGGNCTCGSICVCNPCDC